VKNMQKSLYKLSFKNIEELNNISFYFNDVKNVLNSEIKIEKTGKIVINSNPDLMYEINDINKQQKVNSFLTEQILKIQKRKKAIFESFIKKKDALLEKKIDNREADYRISVLDFYNFFGKENIMITVNDSELEEKYDKFSEEISDKLYKMYKTKDILLTGFALFAMLFGAGNLIFPPMLGYETSSSWLLTMLAFIITGVGFPFLGILSVSIAGNGIKDFANRVSLIFSTIFAILSILAIGPMLAIPRTGATAYEITFLYNGMESPIYKYIYLICYLLSLLSSIFAS